ncbi:MAG: FeS assembly SUF system protein [Planctomycetota bacterium]|jgi:FeS assembly SUF system protein
MSEDIKNEQTSDELNTAPQKEQAVETTPEVKPAEETPAAAAAPETPAAELTPEQLRVQNLVVTVIRTVFDPEIPVNIYELGLIYGIDVSPENDVKVRFTLTSPNCPAAQDLPMEMERKIKALDGITNVEMELSWEPTWSPELMTEAAKLQLNMF